MAARWRHFLFALAFLLFGGAVYSGSGGIQVSPILIDFPQGRELSSVRVHNWRDKDVAFETELMDWSQVDGEDVLTPSSDILIAPSVFSVPAGSEQIVRMALTSKSGGADIERSYRLLVREIPDKSVVQNGLKIQLQMSMPVFVAPANASPSLVIEGPSPADGSALIVRNEGRARARIISLKVNGEVVADKAPRYLLAGSAVKFRLDTVPKEVVVEFMARDGSSTLTRRLGGDRG